MDFIPFFETYGFDFVFWYDFIQDGKRRPFEEYTFKDGSYFDKNGNIVSIAGRDEFTERVACMDFGFALDEVLEKCSNASIQDNSESMNALLKQRVPFSLFSNIQPNTIYFLSLDLSSESHFLVFVATQNQVVTINTYGGIKKMVVKRNSLKDFQQKWFNLIQLSVKPQMEKDEAEVAEIFEEISGIAGINPPYFVDGISSKVAPLRDGKKIVACTIDYISKLKPKPVALQKFVAKITQNQQNALAHEARLQNIGLMQPRL